ncbi:MAG: STAS domain-containing protein [Verrucomicrobiota bacterium]
MSVYYKKQDTEWIIVVEEDILSTSVERLLVEWKKMLEQASELKGVCMDINKVNIIDSQGLNLLIGLYKECVKRAWHFRVTGCSKDIKRMFSLLKLTERFGIQ